MLHQGIIALDTEKQKARISAGLVFRQRLISFETFFRNIQRKHIKYITKIGRGQSKLVALAELTVKREYLVQWKKQRIDPNELAKLYWHQGFAATEAARQCKIRRTSALAAVK